MCEKILRFTCSQGREKTLAAAVILSAAFLIFALVPMSADAAITVNAPPIGYLHQNITVGGGAIVPLVQFRLIQSDGGSDTLSKIGLSLNASTSITQGQISGIGLFKESGVKPGFQFGSDTLVAGAAAGNPAVDDSLIVLTPNTAVSIGNAAVEFYLVATTSAVSTLTNSNGFDIKMPVNYASTTLGSGLGSPFLPAYKVTLERTASVKISEVKAGASTNAGDEFVELYNAGEVDVNLQTLPLNFHTFYAGAGGSTTPVSLKYFNSIIPKHGFFLIASEFNYSGNTSPDAVFATSSFSVIVPNGGVSIATSSGVNSTTTAIDRVGWGLQAGANCENNSDTPASPCAPALAEDGSSLERLAQGYPNATSTAVGMAEGGADSTRGNGVDRGDNSAEFLPQTAVKPQNIQSPTEFPFGGGGQDLEKFRVLSSWPASGNTGIPVDITFIGIDFNKIAATGTFISATATGTVTLTAAGSSTNLCTSTSYNVFPSGFEPEAKCNLSASLSSGTVYTFTATSSIYDLSANALDQDPFQAGNQIYQITFTTGTASQKNITPPSVTKTSPVSGSVNVPTGIDRLAVQFSQSGMKVATFNSSNITLVSSGGTSISLSGFSWDATSSVLTFVPGTLAANTKYILTVGTGVQTQNDIGLPSPYISPFTTGTGADTSPPTVTAVFPAAGSTIDLNAVSFVFTTDDVLDPTTATSGAVTLSTAGVNLPGTVEYDSSTKEGRFSASNPLPAGKTDLALTLVGGALKNLSGTAIESIAFTYSTASSNTDTTGPVILYANADEFGIAITFGESVKEADAEDLANYALTVGVNTMTLSALAGHTVTYDAASRTAAIKGLFLQPASSFVVTVSNIKDISGNAMTASAAVSGTVASSATSKGFLGPGGSTGDSGPKFVDFSASGIGFMPGVNVMPMNSFVSASTTYGFEIPLSQQIPLNGTILITFPATAGYDLCCVATSSASNPFVSEFNKDINGPGTGTVGIKTIAVNNSTSKTVTLTLDTATRSESGDAHDFLHFGLVDLKNPSIPKNASDSSGYTLDIKTRDASGKLLESFTSNPIFIMGGGTGAATTTIQGTVSGNGGDLAGVKLRMMSPSTGMQEATTNASGVYSFSNIPVNTMSGFGGYGSEYFISTDPLVSPTGTTTAFFGIEMPEPVIATSSSILTKNVSLTPTSSAISFTIKLTGDNSSNGIFKAGEQLDVFAGGPSKFVVQTVNTSATNYDGTTLTILSIPQTNGYWGVGIGPAMPKGMGNMNFGPPPSPTWVVPKPINVEVSGCPSACTSKIDSVAATSYTFTISAANRTISGVLKDDSGNFISSAQVFAFSPAAGVGNFAQSSAAGVFTIRVAAGSYNVGAYVPGMGNSREVTVIVDSSGNVYVDGSSSASTGASGGNPFVLKMKKPGYTITGRVTDGTSAVSNAPVYAYRTDGPGHADAMTDSSGNYTLYVDSGTWKVSSYIPGFGPMSEQTVTVTTASQSSINFSPSTATTFYKITGIVFESADANIATSTEGVANVIVRVSGTNGTNEAKTASDGTFTIRVPAGSYTIIDLFKPGYGRIGALDHTLTAIGTLDVSSANKYQPIRMGTRRTVTVNIKDSGGAALSVAKAFIDLFDPSKNFGNYGEISNGTTTTIQVANGASSTIRVHIPGVPPTNVSVASDDTDNTLVLNGVLEVNGNETLKVTINTNTAALSIVSGTVYKTSAQSGNEVADAWVQFVDVANSVHFGTQATSSGIYSIKVANGTYQMQAMKPGYVSAPVSLTVSASTSAANFVLTTSDSTIQGTVKVNGTAVSGAYVWGERQGGGFTSTKTSTDGTYSLKVNAGSGWNLYASSEGYVKTTYSSNPVSAGATGVNFNLTTTASVSSKLASSNTFSDTSSGSLEDTTLGIKVAVDSGTLGSAGTNAYLSAKETSNYFDASDTKIIGSKAFDIDAVNGSSDITNLQSGKTAEVTLTYTVSELSAAGVTTKAAADVLNVISWSDDKGSWETLSAVATYKDSSGNPLSSPASNLSNVSKVEYKTSSATHFSDFALSTPSNPSAPATPSGLYAIQAASSVAVTITWTANTESDLSGYYIYRATNSGGPFPLLASVGAVATYTDSTVVVGDNNYFYKIAAFDTDGFESSASPATGAIAIVSRSSGGSGGIISGGGGGSAATVTSSPTPVVTPAAPALAKNEPVIPSPTPVVTPVEQKTVGISSVFASSISFGSTGTEVRRLQQLLASDKSIYPDARVTGYYGALTRDAVRRFQLKYGVIASASAVGNGRVGPATRAKLAEVFGGAAAETPPVTQAPTPTPISPAQPGGLSQAEIQKKSSEIRAQIKQLQQELLRLQLQLLQEELQKLQK